MMAQRPSGGQSLASFRPCGTPPSVEMGSAGVRHHTRTGIRGRLRCRPRPDYQHGQGYGGGVGFEGGFSFGGWTHSQCLPCSLGLFVAHIKVARSSPTLDVTTGFIETLFASKAPTDRHCSYTGEHREKTAEYRVRQKGLIVPFPKLHFTDGRHSKFHLTDALVSAFYSSLR